jgi:hypothetical protein
MGLVVPRNEAVLRIRNINEANPLTDLKISKLKSKIPLGLQGDPKKWRLFMNADVRYGLQASRIAAAIAGNGNTQVPEPIDSCGIAIQMTDSLVTTERAGLKP